MRLVLAFLLAFGSVLSAGAQAIDYPAVRPGAALAFPRDHGAHPAFRTEWWYVTGWLRAEDGRDLGFQVTFFRTRPAIDPSNPSRFAPAQVLFAHAAISDPEVGHLLHGERAARAGFGIAEATEGDAVVRLRDWSFEHIGGERFRTRVGTSDFTLALDLDPTQPIMLQGENGYSRKGASPDDASYYYSLPHLAVRGELTREGRTQAVTGEAWLDREWSSNFLSPGAVGWDWTGLNFDDGGAMVAFRIRGQDGNALWAGGSLRRPDGTIRRFEPGDVAFETTGEWRSPRTDALYPVRQTLRIRLPEGERVLPLTPMFEDQELDGRSGGLPVYWEGAVTVPGGRGYLELTGYANPLAL